MISQPQQQQQQQQQQPCFATFASWNLQDFDDDFENESVEAGNFRVLNGIQGGKTQWKWDVKGKFIRDTVYSNIPFINSSWWNHH